MTYDHNLEADGKTPYDDADMLAAADGHDAEHEQHPHHIQSDRLKRSLSARQVQMIAIGGTIGTGLFLSTGKSLATGGPGSVLIAYLVVGCIVFVTMLSLGEMAAFIPVAGSFCTFAGRFVDDAFGFALTWNYWFNDAVSMASDLVALQLVLQYWTDNFPGWAVSLIFWFLLIAVNILTVSAYGEVEYWLSLLKVVTIIIFILLGITVNAGGNIGHHYIGGENWRIPGAPFVGGLSGFASVFVTAAFAYGGTESIAITAGETMHPIKNLPRVVRNSTRTSPFTIIFEQVGAQLAGSFINAVILTSVLSAGNHALFTGTRLLYTLAREGHAPGIFGRLNRNQGKTHLLPFKNWTYPIGPWICVVLNVMIVLVQGWTSFAPRFSAVDFIAFYIELPVMLVMYIAWKVIKRTETVSLDKMDLETDVHTVDEERNVEETGWWVRTKRVFIWGF
ncbi:amino acid transporter [Diplogelasinospora grovesii]|uniref:Amino acid transporter n=1 Tax=Diplogelasinospora grovesii TaxID=303347 RepID=A0AAN6MV50_9PEZI|nr:amino acid transporter [Diplogelasinospora grovesii]